MASLSRLDQMCRDFFEYDEDTGVPWSKHSIHAEVHAYINAYDARRRADLIYMNAYANRDAQSSIGTTD
jgi:hypothetical protein